MVLVKGGVGERLHPPPRIAPARRSGEAQSPALTTHDAIEEGDLSRAERHLMLSFVSGKPGGFDFAARIGMNRLGFRDQINILRRSIVRYNKPPWQVAVRLQGLVSVGKVHGTKRTSYFTSNARPMHEGRGVSIKLYIKI